MGGATWRQVAVDQRGVQYARTKDVRLVAWFNEDKETDWAVFGGSNGDETYRSGRTSYKAYKSYRSAVKTSGLLPSNTAQPRLISDKMFAGAW